jgi:Ni,Fe-hydrogenase III large subunit
LQELFADHTGLGDRLPGVGIVSPERAARFAAGGFVGRASGRATDARRLPGYAPYGELDFEVPLREEGDVDARFQVRVEEVIHSLQLIYQLLASLPPGAVLLQLPQGSGEGYGVAETFRGSAWSWLVISGGLITSCFLRDPSWLHWPLLEAAMQNGVVGDFPLVNKSFNASYSGIDL